MLNALFLVVSLLCVIVSADFFIEQSIALAKKLKASSFVIGFTVVALGTSLPEFIISFYSATINHTAITMTNVLGSNIANMCLIIGSLAFYKAFKLTRADALFNIPLNLVVTLIFFAILIMGKGVLTPWAGILLIIIFLLITFTENRFNHVSAIHSKGTFKPVIFIAAIISVLFFGKLAVNYSLAIAAVLHMNEGIFGFFITALGTSFPEFAATYTAIKKGNSEIGIGNILGSNMFNLLVILGSSSLVRTLNFQPYMIDIYILVAITFVLVAAAFLGKKYYYTRYEGLVLLSLYALFVFVQFR